MNEVRLKHKSIPRWINLIIIHQTSLQNYKGVSIILNNGEWIRCQLKVHSLELCEMHFKIFKILTNI